MQKISVYLNQTASSSNTDYWRNRINETLFRYDLSFRETQSLEDLKEMLYADTMNGTDLIIAVGGDGTVHSIIQGIAGAKVKLFVIPTGTANDLANEMGVSKNLKHILRNLKSAQQKSIDLIKVNNRYMATNGGLGLAVDVAKEVNALRKKYPGFKKLMKVCKGRIYSAVLAKRLLSLKVTRYKLLLESKDLPYINKVIESPLVLINNQAKLGANFNIAPKTQNNDGKFNVTVFTHKDNFSFIKSLVKITLGGTTEDDPQVITFETDQLTVHSADNTALPFFGDGEIFEESSILNVSIEAQALQVCGYEQDQSPLSSYSLNEVGLI